MAQSKGKYMEGLAAFRQHPVEPEPVPQEAVLPSAVAGTGATRNTRPVGKRSNPDWKLFSMFLKKQTHRKAANILRNREEADTDLSDLMEELLAGWVSEQSSKVEV